MNQPLKFIIFILGYFQLGLAFSHHGFNAHYDVSNSVFIEGTIKEFRYINPHSFVYVETTNADGEQEIRWCEMQASSQLRIKGINESSLQVGDRIRIEGFQARRDPLGCEFGTGYLADGSVLSLRTRSGQSMHSPLLDQGASQTIFGVWYRKSFPGAGIDPDSFQYLTELGTRASALNNPLTSNPVYRCSPISPIRAWSQPGLPTEIREEGDRIIIHHEFMDTERVIHMNLDNHPANVAPSEMGHSIGRYEEDEIIIETAMFSEGVVRSDFVRTTNFKLTERLRINKDNGDLEVTWEAEDPDYYTENLYGSRILVRTSLPMGRYDCAPGIGHGAQMDPSLG